MKINFLLIVGLSGLLIFYTSCRKNVRGDVRIYGEIVDAYDNAPITDMTFELVRKERRNGETKMDPTITIDNNGRYEVKHVTSENAERGYLFRWQPQNNTREYYFDNLSFGEYLIDGNDCPLDITLKRTGYMTVRLIDVPPYDYFPNLEFTCDGNDRSVDLFNFNGDETFTVKLIPDFNNFYELLTSTNNFTDTIIAGAINMDLSGDTLFNTLQF